jgi:acyl carrier protein
VTHGHEQSPAIPVDEDAILEVVSSVWAEALGRSNLEPDTGFFDLGADSRMVVDVTTALRASWPRLKIADVFANPTVKTLASFLTQEP